MKSLTKAEKIVLPSLASDGYSNCDPTLMYKILRNILPPPRVGWDRKPGLTDITISDDVQRIKILRNKIIHRTSAELSKQEEEHIIPQSLDIAKRLDCYLNRNSDEKFEAWIIKILSSSIDKQLEDEYVERGLKIEELTNALEVIEGNYTLRLKSGKNLKLLLANELWEEEVKPDGIGIVAEVTGFNENEDQQIVEYLNEHGDKINEGKTLVVLKKACLGSITLFLQLLEIMPEEKLYQQIVDVMKKLFQELALQQRIKNFWNVDIMLFPDEFWIKDDFSDKADDDETGKKTLILDLAVNGSSVKDGSGFVNTISDFIGHIITQTNFIHNKCETTDSDELSTLKNRGEQQGSTLKSDTWPDTMVKNLDSTTFVKKLYTGEDRRNLMVLKVDSICNWEQFLMPASTSIAILGELLTKATKTDFSLDKQIPKGGFKFFKYPDSFRACLVQISNSGCKAFIEAHKSMVKIRMYTMQFQETIRYVVNILAKGSEEEKIKILPGMFDELKNDADKCIHLAETTENTFNQVMLLIDETSESSAAVKGVYEDGLKEAVKKMEELEMEEIFIINLKSQSKSDNAKYDVEHRRTELDVSSKARIKYLDEVRKMDKEQTSVLEKLRKTKIESINFEEIQNTLKESLIVLSKLREQWNWLLLFCQNITIEIDVCLSQKTYILYRRLRDGGYSIGHSTRDVVLEMAASVNCVAYSVELIATAFADVSKQHLIPNTASLVDLLAYDPVKECEQLYRRRQQIRHDCMKARDEILALAEKSRKDMERKINDIYDRLEEQLKKLPPLPQAKVQEIKENVRKSSMSESDYI